LTVIFITYILVGMISTTPQRNGRIIKVRSDETLCQGEE
jgi:hypothetical protein